MGEGIRWRYVFFGVLLYLVLVVALGALLINTLAEPIGPITDLVLTSLMVLVISHVAAERSCEEGSIFQAMVVGMVIGIGSAVGQGVLALIFGQFTAVSLSLTLVSYALAGLLAGAMAIIE